MNFIPELFLKFIHEMTTFHVSQLWILNLLLFVQLLYKSIICKFAYSGRNTTDIYISLKLPACSSSKILSMKHTCKPFTLIFFLNYLSIKR